MLQPTAQEVAANKNPQPLSPIPVDDVKKKTKTFTYEEVVAAALAYFNGDELASNT